MLHAFLNETRDRVMFAKHPRFLSISAALLLAVGPQASWAADTAPATPTAAKPALRTAEPLRVADPLGAARAHIAQKNWAAALEELKRLNNTASADWNNLMGYCLRKNTPTDLPGSENFYNQALRIQPDHRGALEYSGELYLMLGDLPKAEARLSTLNQVCKTGCEEQQELSQAVARYKANNSNTGSKY
jgi:Flp pilus assembly protein TadD